MKIAMKYRGETYVSATEVGPTVPSIKELREELFKGIESLTHFSFLLEDEKTVLVVSPEVVKEAVFLFTE